MKSKTQIPSSKSLEKDSFEMINKRCKQDHFNYTKQLPIKKNLSSYTSAYKDLDIKEFIQNNKIQEFRKKIAPPLLNPNLLKRSLHESNVHFSPNKATVLPSLKIGTTYKANYLQRSNDKIVKGKQQDGFFIKMPWHDSPSSNYRKSYDKSNKDTQLVQKAKPVEGHIQLIKQQFKGHSSYEECYSPFKKNGHSDSKDCIKNKDHITGGCYPLKGQSQYKSRYDPNTNKQNESSSKSIKSKKRLSLLPQIKPNRGTHVQKQAKEKLPKKSLKMNKTKSNPVGQENKNFSTHDRIFGVVEQN